MTHKIVIWFKQRMPLAKDFLGQTMWHNCAGFTVTNMMVVSIILGILAIPVARYLTRALQGITTETRKAKSQDALRNAFAKLETDFMDMNEITISEDQRIEFMMDSYRMPGYRAKGDLDGDGILNEVDADDDNDLTDFTKISAGMGGYDHQDNDDDAIDEGHVDVYCRYRLNANNELIREFNYNEAGYGKAEVLAENIMEFQLTYLGSKNEEYGFAVDLGEDGLPGTGDAGEQDGKITAIEISRVTDANDGHGNGNDVIDTPEERLYIVSIHVHVVQDLNKDGRSDFSLDTELAPPMLTIKRRF